MIYIWFNPVSDSYQLGSLRDLRVARDECVIKEDFILLYRFPEQKRWLADKIMKQLNVSTREKQRMNEENSFHSVM